MFHTLLSLEDEDLPIPLAHSVLDSTCSSASYVCHLSKEINPNFSPLSLAAEIPASEEGGGVGADVKMANPGSRFHSSQDAGRNEEE